MEIRIKDNTSKYDLADAIGDFIEGYTRFTLGSIECHNPRINNGLKIREVRLKEKKPYCGNHPAECELLPWQTEEPKRRMARYLEGADWVEFNDRINDVLDHLDCAANIRTAVCIIRKGRARRTYYGHHYEGHFTQWDLDEGDWAYKINTTCAEASEYPMGTPGLYERANYDSVGWTMQRAQKVSA